MQTTLDIIKALGGSTTLAGVIGVPLGTVSAWGTRGSIPPEYWPQLVELAASRRVKGVTFEKLAKIAAAKRELGHAPDHAASEPSEATN